MIFFISTPGWNIVGNGQCQLQYMVSHAGKGVIYCFQALYSIKTFFICFYKIIYIFI